MAGCFIRRLPAGSGRAPRSIRPVAPTIARPAMTRDHLLRAAARQFVEGDVQHWWLPHSGQGVRTRISDDRVWLAYGVATYIQVSGDEEILNEIVPFLDGPALKPG